MNRKKVLIIDDEDFIIELVKDVLSLEEIECFSAKNFSDGLGVLKQESFNLILADKNIENSSLVKFTEAKKIEGIKTPVILITGERGLTTDEVKRLGADDVIYKPFKMEAFLSTVQNLME